MSRLLEKRPLLLTGEKRILRFAIDQHPSLRFLRLAPGRLRLLPRRAEKISRNRQA
jgi:hypothetical protein